MGMIKESGFIDLNAAADFLGNGAIEINMYDNDIFDIVTRKSIAFDRFPKKKATGQPTRYFEQNAISSAAFNDPRNMTPTPSSPSRQERYASIKCITNQTNLSMFDKEVTEQQGQFAEVVTQDIEDIANGIILTVASALWTGNDTSLTTPTTLQYMGLLNQITLQSTVVPSASIIDGLKAAVADMVANITYDVWPTAIFLNPILANYAAQEMKASKIDMNVVEVVGGVKVKTISTEAGELPLIADKFIPSASGSAYGFGAPPAGNNNYFAVIVTEPLIEIRHISGSTDNHLPRIFQLGLTNNLSGQYVGTLFNNVIAKGAGYAHQVVCIQRP